MTREIEAELGDNGGDVVPLVLVVLHLLVVERVGFGLELVFEFLHEFILTLPLVQARLEIRRLASTFHFNNYQKSKQHFLLR